jgi:hypothetical protein
MTDASVPSPGTPHEVLADLGELTRRVRAAQRGAWFPLLLFGVLTLGGILVNRFTVSVRTVPCPVGQGTGCTLIKQGSPVYWTLGFALAYAATAVFYIRHSRNRGIGTPVRPYLLSGIVVVAVVAATAFWSYRHTTPDGPLSFWGLRLDAASGWTQLLERATGSAAVVGLPLLVLSWVERSLALGLLAAVYLAIELVPLGTGWAGISRVSPWSSLPHFAVLGVLLLLGALGFSLAQLPRRRAAS